MEITNDFKKVLKKVKLLKNEKKPSFSFSFFLSSKKQTYHLQEFNQKIRKLCQTISKMKTFLIQNRKDYINVYCNLLSQASTMTEIERDKIDSDMTIFMKTCQLQIEYFKLEVKNKLKLSTQKADHYFAIIDLIQQYLKSVCDIYSQQKAIRVRRAFDKQKLSRLEINLTFKDENYEFQIYSRKNDKSKIENKLFEKKFEFKSDNKEDLNEKVPSAELTVEEMQMFEEENRRLYQELNEVTEETRQIEGKVVEIARLQGIFTENVLKQEQDLNRLNETAIESTEYIKTGNEQLRDAIKKKASLRIWILFFTITLAFTLLFLDWYNP